MYIYALSAIHVIITNVPPTYNYPIGISNGDGSYIIKMYNLDGQEY